MQTQLGNEFFGLWHIARGESASPLSNRMTATSEQSVKADRLIRDIRSLRCAVGGTD